MDAKLFTDKLRELYAQEPEITSALQTARAFAAEARAFDAQLSALLERAVNACQAARTYVHDNIDRLAPREFYLNIDAAADRPAGGIDPKAMEELEASFAEATAKARADADAATEKVKLELNSSKFQLAAPDRFLSPDLEANADEYLKPASEPKADDEVPAA